jgi:cellulose synthase/poly-beta-1,6-N-acetylglucosamine synthase-like glycosyltransferase
MNLVINIIHYGLAMVLGGLLGYQVILSLLALTVKEVRDFHTHKKRKFAILIPAHNEEKIITKTLYSLFGLVYPKKLYDLIVIADNCTDQTAKLARNLGAKVMERHNPDERGKGFALRWAFDQLLKEEEHYDAIVVFDSDSLVSGNYLDVMNYYLEKGARVIQSSDLVIPQPEAWSSEATRIGFLLYNYVKPLGRKALGLGVGLRGNGMCFTPEVLREVPWEAWSLTEDLEYGLNLLLQNVHTEFAPEAYVWAQMPKVPKNAETQRTRWEMGRYPIIKKYSPRLFTAFIKRGAIKYLDALIELITPPLVNTLLVVMIILLLTVAGWLVGWFSIGLIWIWSGITLLGGLHLLLGLIVVGADHHLLKSLIYIPRYAFWKMALYVRKWANQDNKNWVRTTREHR